MSLFTAGSTVSLFSSQEGLFKNTSIHNTILVVICYACTYIYVLLCKKYKCNEMKMEVHQCTNFHKILDKTPSYGTSSVKGLCHLSKCYICTVSDIDLNETIVMTDCMGRWKADVGWPFHLRIETSTLSEFLYPVETICSLMFVFIFENVGWLTKYCMALTGSIPSHPVSCLHACVTAYCHGSYTFSVVTHVSLSTVTPWSHFQVPHHIQWATARDICSTNRFHRQFYCLIMSEEDLLVLLCCLSICVSNQYELSNGVTQSLVCMQFIALHMGILYKLWHCTVCMISMERPCNCKGPPRLQNLFAILVAACDSTVNI